LGAAGHSTDEVGAAVLPSIVTSGRKKIVRGDVVSVCPTIFDGDEPGSYSEDNPERCYGVVQSVRTNGLVSVEWENKDVDDVKLKDLKKEPTHTMSYQIY
jgi:translation initiation factor IF-1